MDGKRYTGSDIEWNRMWKRIADRKEANAMCEQYAVGREIDVFHVPGDPKRARLKGPAWEGGRLPSRVIYMLLLLVALYLLRALQQ